MCNVCAVRLQTEGCVLEFAFRMTKCFHAQQEPACFVLRFDVTISVTKFQSSGPPACGAGGEGRGGWAVKGVNTKRESHAEG